MTAPAWEVAVIVALWTVAASGAWSERKRKKDRQDGEHRRAPKGAHDSEARAADAPAPGPTTSASAHRSFSAAPGAATAAAGGLTVTVAPDVAAFRAMLGTGARPRSEVEAVEGDMPILAHRAARLRFGDGRKPFGSVAYHVWFGVDADAGCEAATKVPLPGGGFTYLDRHASPDLACNCGWYALPPDMDPTYTGPHLVTLLVELSGTVIEHTKGYRAEHQRVVECKLPWCPVCGEPADYMVLNALHLTLATCERHRPVLEAGQISAAWDADSLSQMLGVPVTRGRHE